VRQNSSRYDIVTYTDASHRNLEMFKDLREIVLNISADTNREDRLEKSLCLVCYHYRSRAGGQAITHKPCDICLEDMCFASTCTDKLCKTCSKKLKVCTRCGGDMELKTRRKLNIEEIKNNGQEV
jgi:hypothetical protein